MRNLASLDKSKRWATGERPQNQTRRPQINLRFPRLDLVADRG